MVQHLLRVQTPGPGGGKKATTALEEMSHYFLEDSLNLYKYKYVSTHARAHTHIHTYTFIYQLNVHRIMTILFH